MNLMKRYFPVCACFCFLVSCQTVSLKTALSKLRDGKYSIKKEFYCNWRIQRGEFKDSGIPYSIYLDSIELKNNAVIFNVVALPPHRDLDDAVKCLTLVHDKSINAGKPRDHITRDWMDRIIHSVKTGEKIGNPPYIQWIESEKSFLQIIKPPQNLSLKHLHNHKGRLFRFKVQKALKSKGCDMNLSFTEPGYLLSQWTLRFTWDEMIQSRRRYSPIGKL